MNSIEHFINGKITKGSSKKTSKVFNPATGEQTAEVNLASKNDIDLAVEKAKKAFTDWSKKPPAQRARVIFKFKELIEKNSDEIIKLIVSEHGKVYEDAKGSLTRGLEVVEFACGIPHLLKGEFTENVGTDVDSWSIRQPLGVCAGITPFNFPAMVPMWMFPIAIACGNTFVLKPSEKDPSCSIKLALQKYSGLPTNKVVGMAGILDSSRFKYFLSQEIKVPVKNINALVLGGHGDTMVPLPNHTTVNDKTLMQMVKENKITKNKLDSIVDRTRKGGGEINKLLEKRLCILCTCSLRCRNGRIIY